MRFKSLLSPICAAIQCDGGTMDLLFDLSADIGERRNLGRFHPEIVADLKTRLAAWEGEMAREPKTFMVR